MDWDLVGRIGMRDITASCCMLLENAVGSFGGFGGCDEEKEEMRAVLTRLSKVYGALDDKIRREIDG